MDNTASETTPEPQVIFRGKKRKTYRQRTERADDEDSNLTETPKPENTADTSKATPLAQSEDTAKEEKGLSVAEVLRLRNARKARLGGVKFGAGNNNAPGDAAGEALDDLSLMIREEENKALDIAAGVQKRFAPQTGMAAELVNKHM
ncbi:hypothetical protein K449DRAFT_274035 [Hypoxylon sp. EC38]|nr:hypothetical protein K449DRAFT_274035 [Hypoxylon sp. EC38]